MAEATKRLLVLRIVHNRRCDVLVHEEEKRQAKAESRACEPRRHRQTRDVGEFDVNVRAVVVVELVH